LLPKKPKIERIGRLEEELTEPYQAWQTQPGPATGGNLLRALTPTIDSAVRNFGGKSAGPLLRSKARRIVLDSLPRYQPSSGPLRTFLTSQLQGLRRAAAEGASIISVPEQIRLERHHLFEATESLHDELGREPDDTEIADRTGLSFKRLAKIRGASPALVEGALRSPGESGEMEQFQPATSMPGAQGALSDDAWTRFVYLSLEDPKDRFILEHSLGLNGKPLLDNRAIAVKLRVTPSAVSQRRVKIQRALNSRSELGVLE